MIVKIIDWSDNYWSYNHLYYFDVLQERSLTL